MEDKYFNIAQDSPARSHSHLHQSIVQIRALPPLQRTVYLEMVYVEHPRMERILAKAQLCLDRALRCKEAGIKPADPPCMLLVGRTGAGKTTLSLEHLRRNPPIIVHPGPQQPKGYTRHQVLRGAIPNIPTQNTLARELLKATGDPLYDKGTGAVMTHRLYENVSDPKTGQVMLDELQHFVDQDSSRLLFNASNWLKNFIKENGIACILIGKQGEAELVVRENDQLASLFGDPIVLEPFYWRDVPSEELKKPAKDRNIEGTSQEFRVFLRCLESQLPLNQPSHLSDPDRAQRLFVACDGLLRPLMILIRSACEAALIQNVEKLDDWLLADAFDLWLGPESRHLANPFRGPLQKPRELPPIVMKRIKSGTRHGKPSVGYKAT